MPNRHPTRDAGAVRRWPGADSGSHQGCLRGLLRVRDFRSRTMGIGFYGGSKDHSFQQEEVKETGPESYHLGWQCLQSYPYFGSIPLKFVHDQEESYAELRATAPFPLCIVWRILHICPPLRSNELLCRSAVPFLSLLFMPGCHGEFHARRHSYRKNATSNILQLYL